MADQVTKVAYEDTSFKQECDELKSKTEKPTTLSASSDTFQLLNSTSVPRAASSRRLNRSPPTLKTPSTTSPSSSMSRPGEADNEYLDGLPPIAGNKSILRLIWERIIVLHIGSPKERSDAAASPVSLASDNHRYEKLIIEEGECCAWFLLSVCSSTMVISDENRSKPVNPTNFQGGMNCGGNRKVGQNRRALSVINQDLVAEGRPYPCVVNKRALAE
ncbi:hypothetical protein ACSQ67_003292 [Phaseolus vulgaris]